MSEFLYMTEIEQLLEGISEMASSFDPDCQCVKCVLARKPFADARANAIVTLTRHYGLNLDNAQSEVAAAAGEEP